MEIVFVISHMTKYVGAGKFLMDFANILSGRNNKITIIGQKFDKNRFKFRKEIKLIEAGGSLPSNPFFWLNFRRIKKLYLEIINRLNFELIVALDFPSNYICSSLINRHNFKYIYYCLEPYRYFHDKNFYKNAPSYLRVISFFLRLFFKKYDIEGVINADKIISISKFTSSRVANFYGKKSNFIHHIGINFDEDKDVIQNIYQKKLKIIEETNPIFFSLGFTHHLKGAKELIFIFHKFLQEFPSASLIIGGWMDKNCSRVISKFIKQLEIPNEKIHYFGFIKNSKIDLIYQKSTFTLYTALDESYGLIPLESMKNGTPVIAFEGGPSETIINGKTGFIITKNNIDQIVYRATKLIKNKYLYMDFSRNSINHIIKDFDFHKSVLDLELFFQRVISG